MSGRGISWLARNGTKANFKGLAMVAFNKGPKVVTNHPMDTEQEEYYRVIQNVVIPSCMGLTPHVPEFQRRMSVWLSMNHPLFDPCWNFGVELLYRMVAPPDHQTPDNLMRARIMRTCCDMVFNIGGLIDDLTDESELRGGRPCWYRVCPGGRYAAVYDSVLAGYLPYFLIRKFFWEEASYHHLVEGVSLGMNGLMIGQVLDTLHQGAVPSLPNYIRDIHYKTGYTYIPQAVLGTAFAGILEDSVIQKVSKAFVIVGRVAQQWDDFNDYYASVTAAGKNPEDFKNGANTWASAMAFEVFSPAQKKAFLELYGSADPEKVEAAKEMYDEINMPWLYLKQLREHYLCLRPIVNSLPNKRLQEAVFSYAKWIIGEVCDDQFAKEIGL